MFDPTRNTGKTTRLLETVKASIDSGRAVLVVCGTHQQCISLAHRLFEIAGPQSWMSRERLEVRTAGGCRFTAVGNLGSLAGHRFDEFHSDPGELETHELAKVLPLIRQQTVTA